MGRYLRRFWRVCAWRRPTPAIVQRPGQWTLDVRYEHPQQLVLPWGPGGEQRFWYMIVTVTNRTGMDVEFYPKCDLMTDTFQIVPAGRAVPPVVFEMIQQRHASRYPLLESLQSVPNRVLEGEDNARDIAIIWQDFDPQAASFQVFVSGLSNETAVIAHPVASGRQRQARAGLPPQDPRTELRPAWRSGPEVVRGSGLQRAGLGHAITGPSSGPHRGQASCSVRGSTAGSIASRFHRLTDPESRSRTEIPASCH